MGIELKHTALEFVEAIPAERWVIVKNTSEQGMKDLISEYNRRNPHFSLQFLIETDDNNNVRVKRNAV